MTDFAVDVVVKPDKAKRGIDQVDRGLTNLGKSADRTGQLIKRAMGFLGAAAVVSFLSSTKRLSVEFSSSLAEVSTLLGETAGEMDLLTEAAKRQSIQFGTQPVQQSQAFYQIISAGAENAAEAITTLEAANKLAIGGVTGIQVAADGLTSVLNAYGDQVKSATDVSDTMFVAMKAGKTTIGELSSSLGKVAPIAASLEVRFDELLASISALTKGGISTQESVTGVRAILAAVAKPTKESSTLAKELGLNFSAAGLKARGLAGFLEDVADKTQGNVSQLALLFGGVEALVPILALTGTAAETFSDIMKSMTERAGSTEKAFDKIAKSPGFKLNRFMSAIRIESLKLGDALVTVLAPAALLVADNITTLTDATKLLGITLAVAFGPKMIAGIASVLATKLLPALIAVKRALLIVQTSLLIGGFSMILPVIGAVAVALGGPLVIALVAVGAAAFVAQDLFVKFFNFLGLNGKKVLVGFVAVVEGTISVAIGLFKGFTEAVMGSINFLQIQLYKADDAIKKRFGKRADPGDFGLDPESAIRGGRSIAENFQRGFEEGSKGFGLVDKLILGETPKLEAPKQGVVSKEVDKVTSFGITTSDAANEALERQEKLLQSIKGPQLNYNQNHSDLITLLNRGSINQEEYTTALRGFKIEVLETSRSLEGGLQRGLLQVEDQFTNLAMLAEDTLVNAFQSVEDSFVSFVTTGKLGFSDLINSMLADIARLHIRQAITGPVAQSLGSIDYSSIFSNLMGFERGGSFRVGGVGGVDSQTVAFKATPDEHVTISRPDQLSSGSPVVVNVINNTPVNVDVKPTADGTGQSLEIILDEAQARNIRNPSSKTYRTLQQSQGLVRR